MRARRRGGDDAWNPTVSVVVTTYYRNDRLREAIESVRDQAYEPIEIVVVDGSGEGHAAPVVADYDVRYVEQETDRGAHAARSDGAEVATGELVNFLDDDDVFLPGKLEQQVELLARNDEVGVVYCGKETEDGRVMMPDPDVRGDVLDYALKFQMTPSSPSTMLIRAEVLEEILPLKNTHGADDMGMKIELAQLTEFDYVDEALVRIGDSEDSLGGSMENVRGRMLLLETYADLYDRHPPEIRRTALAYTYLLEADIRLDRKPWSATAIYRALLGCYLIPGVRLPFLGYLLSSILGRPGRDAGRRIYFDYVLGDDVRGKIA